MTVVVLRRSYAEAISSLFLQYLYFLMVVVFIAFHPFFNFSTSISWNLLLLLLFLDILFFFSAKHEKKDVALNWKLMSNKFWRKGWCNHRHCHFLFHPFFGTKERTTMVMIHRQVKEHTQNNRGRQSWRRVEERESLRVNQPWNGSQFTEDTMGYNGLQCISYTKMPILSDKSKKQSIMKEMYM